MLKNLQIALPILIIRATVAFIMVHHGLEKISDVEGFTTFVVDKYFNFLPLSHSLWTLAAGYVQIICSLLIMVGLLFRISLIMISSTMIFALFFHFSDTGLQNAPLGIVPAHNYEFETSLLYLLLYVLLFIFGSGQLAISQIFKSKFTKVVSFWL